MVHLKAHLRQTPGAPEDTGFSRKYEGKRSKGRNRINVKIILQ
jgi:hypothetical protein